MKKILKRVLVCLVVLVAAIVAAIAFKGAKTFSIVSTGQSLFSPTDKRWDVLILGHRGETASGGGVLTDSIMVLSYKKETNEAAIFSIPRDLFVQIPGNGYQRINFAYPAGEAGTGKSKDGLELSKKVVSQVTGLDIDFAVISDTDALKAIVDSIGGITVYEDKTFYANFYRKEVQVHPGENKLNGSQVLAYTGMRKLDSDFGRMKRQQKVLMAIKDKVLSLGIVSRPDKIWNILNSLEKHFKTDLNMSQIQFLIRNMSKFKVDSTKQMVFDNTNYLYSTMSSAGAYILLPKAGNYSEIHTVCKNIFNKNSNINTTDKTNVRINTVGKF
jgi:LCP family protein required for cell wall assembly